jgi:glycosyltransferase involved in cell wall biosynthesis
MRIAFYAPRAAYLEPGLSGDVVYVRNLLKGLRARGHELLVISRLDVRDLMRGRVPARRLLAEALSIRRLSKRFAPDAWLVYGATVRNPDLFGWWQRPRRYVLLAAGRGKADQVPKPWRHVFRFAHRRSLARADWVVSYRPKSDEDFRSLGIPDERRAVLPLAIEAWPDVPTQEEARTRLGLARDGTLVLCVSRLPPPKKDGRPWKTELVVQTVKAMASVPAETVLLVVGDGPGRKRVEDEVTQLGLSERVLLAGEVPNEELATYYAACDVFALPDLLDRPWLCVLEAQWCGRPIVTTDTPASRVTIRADRTGLLASDLDDFAVQLRKLASDRALCRRMGEAARDYVAAFHTLDVRIDQIEELLDGGPAQHGEQVPKLTEQAS